MREFMLAILIGGLIGLLFITIIDLFDKGKDSD